jgi:hypothetical protein
MVSVKSVGVLSLVGLGVAALDVVFLFLATQAGITPPQDGVSAWVTSPVIAFVAAVVTAYATTKLQIARLNDDQKEAKEVSRVLRSDVDAKPGRQEFDMLRQIANSKADVTVVVAYEKFIDRLLDETYSKNEAKIEKDNLDKRLAEMQHDIRELNDKKVSDHRLNNALTPITGSLSEVKESCRDLGKKFDDHVQRAMRSAPKERP